MLDSAMRCDAVERGGGRRAGSREEKGRGAQQTYLCHVLDEHDILVCVLIGFVNTSLGGHGGGGWYELQVKVLSNRYLRVKR